MITTVCMNPSFDKTASVSALRAGGMNRLQGVRYDVGGKGINVATVLKRLGVEAECVGCLGAENGAAFLALLEKERLTFHHFSLSGNVRTNVKLWDAEAQAITELNEEGPEMTAAQQTAFLALLLEKTQGSKFIVFSGSVPAGCAPSTYQAYIRSLKGDRCVLDATGEALRLAISERPFLIKPNLPEMEEIMHTRLSSLDSVRKAALSLIDQGARNVMVSLGKDGALLVTENNTLYAKALPVEARSTVGAGDAMLGGMLMGLDQGEGIEASFPYGIAAGAASVMTEGTQLLQLSDFERLLPQVRVEKL